MCLKYFNNSVSRVIKKRAEGHVIKPFETLRNIRAKNDLVMNMSLEEKVDEVYNARIEAIDNLVVERDDLDCLERKKKYLIVEHKQIKEKVGGKREKNNTIKTSEKVEALIFNFINLEIKVVD
ncbi:hypothetical protein GLOIN_2v1870465 [Rhizophagus irregularis DAOM 181602=DAOM 197198]|uniref:Uncharacterized protein n=2 Tax=Rhizophagus irregularis (strain DAOM 181602 / DAOM 197198 / MUCL 43194) TaxID=747089 RepID=A0A2P4QLZ5_RHIID|nr:hypothetical protein GLOIN_2v1870465 [Rhizophagus irregularis DAOM 181602=DAOM 197198]POG78677.1 hypothetical protein GLOIN_2v1870465 [Rhizophagus irregularis DAOM 181602=DAOM 197198]|eukprot:XP_025185543.1 hypothetical protein GLOIN_2v1870465 [Rhizophagus irregularis DAOM 181602=DAOM 197198]